METYLALSISISVLCLFVYPSIPKSFFQYKGARPTTSNVDPLSAKKCKFFFFKCLECSEMKRYAKIICNVF